MRRDTFRALADPTRRAIITLIAAGTMTPNAIAEHFPAARQTVSRHIKVLTESQLLKKQESAGREIYYSLNAKKLKEAADWLEAFRSMWEEKFNKLDSLLDTMKKTKKNAKK